MMRRPSKDNDPARREAPDGLRRKFLRAGGLSAAVVASLLSGRGRAAAEDAGSLEAAADGSDLASAIRDLKAREEIKELRALYCWYATRADAKSYAELFTSDCVFEYKTGGERRIFEGPEAISAIVAAIAPGTVTPVIGNHTIKINGNEATGTCAARNTIRGEDGTSEIVVGFYDDKFRYEEGRWRFFQRRWFTYTPEYEENDVPLV